MKESSNQPQPVSPLQPANATETSLAHDISNNDTNQLSATNNYLQCKFSISDANDPLENEADEVAHQAMQMPQPNFVQRQCNACVEEERVQQKPLTNFIQRKETHSTTQASEAVTETINRSRGGGSGMDSGTQSFMENRFGASFSNVRIHAGSEAVQMNRELQAKAFTVGNDIYFNQGQYNPNSNEGKYLLAHELTHTLQQGGNNINRKMIQRLGDLTTMPSGLPCLVPNNNTQQGFHYLFQNNSSTLTPDQELSIRNVAMNWVAMGGNAPVRIDGYASSPGEQPHNWDLSCTRAQRAKTILTDSGTPDRFISTYMNGETTDFGSEEQNRRVNIYINTPTPTPTPIPVPPADPSRDITRNLICDLSSPITVGSRPRYEVGQHGDEMGPTGAEIRYRWTVIDRATGTEVSTATTTANTISIPAAAAGRFRVRAQITSNGNVFSTLHLDQEVVAEDAFLTREIGGRTGNDIDAYRELVNDFRNYIIDAARATGVNGISPAFLASVLLVEVSNRPKAGRESEIEDIGGYLSTLERGSWLLPGQRINRSVGVGQIRLSTAAMLLGNTPWIDQDRSDRSVARDRINSNFDGLSLARQRAIYNLLRMPRTNIVVAANLLSRIKNRSNRYPTENRTTFALHARGVQIVATEYNQGSTSTAEADASPSGYGTWVWNNVSTDAIIQHYFPNN